MLLLLHTHRRLDDDTGTLWSQSVRQRPVGSSRIKSFLSLEWKLNHRDGLVGDVKSNQLTFYLTTTPCPF